jgi:Tol biopolymer transport system component/DNA-binding winged helix-turn-helix (wHTH) protein
MNTLADQPVFEFAGFRLDAAQRRLYGPDGQPIPLAARAFDTLLYLLEHPGALLDKNTIMQAVWPNVVVAENNLNQAITQVRRALGEGHIVTIPGRGYQFVTPVTRRTKLASPALPPDPALDTLLDSDFGTPAQGAGETPPPVTQPEQLPTHPRPNNRTTPKPARRRAWLGWVAAAGVTITVAWIGAWLVLRSPAPIVNPIAGARFTRLTDFPGDETSAAISPDGKFVTFVSRREDSLDMWLSQIGTGRFQNLTMGDFLTGNSRLSREGGFTGDGTEIWLRGPPPDTQRMRLLPLMGGAPRPFLDNLANNVDWSPDGAHIVYQSIEPGDPLYIADRDGTNARQVYIDRPGMHNHFPTWSTDGRWIYFVKVIPTTFEADLWRIALTGGEPEQLTANNKYLAYPTPLDTRTVLYVAEDADSSGPWLWSLDIESKIAQRISAGLEQYTSIAASANHGRLVAVVANPVANLWSVPILDRLADESDVQAYAVPSARALMPRFSGTDLYYLSSQGGGDGLWRFEDDQAVEIWRGSDGALLEPPGVSADGRQLAVVIRRNGRHSLWVLQADGAQPRVLTNAIDIRGTAAWSHDGLWLAAGGIDAQGAGLFKIPVAGGTPVRLADTGFNPVWSPSGDLIVYSGSDVGGNQPLHAVTADGDPVELPAIQIRAGGERFRFLPGGQALIYMQGGFYLQDFWRLDLATLQTRRLTQLSKQDAMRTFDIAPDGQRIVFDRLRQNSDIVLIDLRQEP